MAVAGSLRQSLLKNAEGSERSAILDEDLSTETSSQCNSDVGRLQTSLPGNDLQWSRQLYWVPTSLLKANNDFRGWGHPNTMGTSLQASSSFFRHII